MDRSPPDPSATAKTRLPRPVLALCSLLAMLVVLEIAARLALGDDFRAGELRDSRWTIVGRFDPDMGWSNRPNARGHVVVRTPGVEFEYRARINSLGMRDPERTVQKPSGVRRVVVLGDSMTWGWGANDGERYTDVLERELGPGVEVLNFAVPGYGTDQEYWTLTERAAAFEPDVVLLCFILNDVIEVESAHVYDMDKPRFAPGPDGNWVIENRPVRDPRSVVAKSLKSCFDTAAEWSGLVAWTRRRQQSDTWSDPSGESLDDGASGDGQALRPIRPHAIELVHGACDKLTQKDSATHMLLGKLEAWCDEKHLPFIVFSLPHHHDQFLYDLGMQRPPFDPGPENLPFQTYLSEKLHDAGRELGFETFSVDQAMWEATGRGEKLHCGDGHLNARGHDLVARSLMPFVRSALERAPKH